MNIELSQVTIKNIDYVQIAIDGKITAYAYYNGYASHGYIYGADHTISFTSPDMVHMNYVTGCYGWVFSPKGYMKKGLIEQVREIMNSTKIGRKIAKKSYRQIILAEKT